jgi:hypothetical protein
MKCINQAVFGILSFAYRSNVSGSIQLHLLHSMKAIMAEMNDGELVL